MSIDRPYYTVLGLDQTANQAHIRAAYRSLVKSAHPDVGGDPEAFILLNEAYNTLSDPKKRAEYDLIGKVEDWHPLAFQESLIRSLADAFEAALDSVHSQGASVDDVQFFAGFRELLRKGLEGMEGEDRLMKRDLKEMGSLRARTKRRGEERNIFVEILDAKIKEKEAALRILSRDLQVARRAVEEMAHYTEISAFMRTMQAARYTGSSSTYAQTTLGDLFLA